MEKEKNAKINEKKKEDESKAQVILMIHKKHINKLLLLLTFSKCSRADLIKYPKAFYPGFSILKSV